jgi:hypothetical protein
MVGLGLGIGVVVVGWVDVMNQLMKHVFMVEMYIC